jgi:CheY-like chemotaxis protein
VLVVEDEPQVLTFVSSQLESLGYDVTAVASGPDALRILEHSKDFDLLFTDVVLPHGMSGVELAQRVRTMGLDTKVLLTSGYAEEVFAQHGRPPADVLLLAQAISTQRFSRDAAHRAGESRLRWYVLA